MKLLTAQLWEVHYKEVFCRNPLQTFSKCIQWALLHLKRAMILADRHRHEFIQQQIEKREIAGEKQTQEMKLYIRSKSSGLQKWNIWQ